MNLHYPGDVHRISNDKPLINKYVLSQLKKGESLEFYDFMRLYYWTVKNCKLDDISICERNWTNFIDEPQKLIPVIENILKREIWFIK